MQEVVVAIKQKSVAIGTHHYAENGLVQGIISHLEKMKDSGLSHLGLEAFKQGSIDGHANEANGLKLYTQGAIIEAHADIRCALDKAERLDMADHIQQTGLNIRLQDLAPIQQHLQERKYLIEPNLFNKPLQECMKACKKGRKYGYRALLDKMRELNVTGIGIDKYGRNLLEIKESVLQGNRDFAEAISQEKTPANRILVICGAMHLGKMIVDGQTDPGLLNRFGMTGFYYTDSAKQAVLAFKDSIDSAQVEEIAVIGEPTTNLLTVNLSRSTELQS